MKSDSNCKNKWHLPPHLYSSPNIRTLKVKGGVEEVRNEYKILVGKPDRKRLLGMSMSKWKDNIKIGFKERGFNGVG